MRIIQKIKKFFIDNRKKENINYTISNYGTINNSIIYCTNFIDNIIGTNILYLIYIEKDSKDSITSLIEYCNILTQLNIRYITKIKDNKIYCLCSITDISINNIDISIYKKNSPNRFIKILFNDIINILPSYSKFFVEFPYDNYKYFMNPFQDVLQDISIINMDNPNLYNIDTNIFTIKELLSLSTISILYKSDIDIIYNDLTYISTCEYEINGEFYKLYNIYIFDYFRYYFKHKSDELSDINFLYDIFMDNDYFNITSNVINNNDSYINIIDILKMYPEIYENINDESIDYYKDIDEVVD